MEFLYKLYEQKYFGTCLLGAIIFLSILFLIILFAGKKDKNKRLEETKKLELAAISNKEYKEVDENTKEIRVPEIAQPKVEETVAETTIDEQKTFAAEETIPSLDEIQLKESTNVNVDKNELENEINVDLNSLFDDNEEQEVEKEEVKEVPSQIPFELPKVAEMPKLKEGRNSNENIFGEVKQDNNIFSNIENETYNLK